jgi:hypothetical protein
MPHDEENMAQRLLTFEEVGSRRIGIHRGGRKQKYILDEPGRRLILARYDGSSRAINDIMRYFTPRGIPRSVVRKWAAQMGLARQKGPQWTAEEEAYLETYLHKMSLATIAKHLGRTRTAVKLKAKRLGTSKTAEGYTMRGLCLGLGVDHHKVTKWVERGWMKGSRRNSDRTSNGDIWYFSDRAIKEMVRTHPEEIDPRRVEWLWFIDVLLGVGSLID